MKKTILLGILVLVAVLATAGIALAAAANFRTHLNGDNEVPLRVTLAQGYAIFQLNKDLSPVWPSTRLHPYRGLRILPPTPAGTTPQTSPSEVMR